MSRVIGCSHDGNKNDGNQAPPSIVAISTTKIPTERVACGVLPSVDTSTPALEASSANATDTIAIPSGLPRTRTPSVKRPKT